MSARTVAEMGTLEERYSRAWHVEPIAPRQSVPKAFEEAIGE